MHAGRLVDAAELVGGNFLAVYSKIKEQQEGAYKFMEFLTSREAFEIWLATGYLNVTTNDIPVRPGNEAGRCCMIGADGVAQDVIGAVGVAHDVIGARGWAHRVAGARALARHVTGASGWAHRVVGAHGRVRDRAD